MFVTRRSHSVAKASSDGVGLVIAITVGAISAIGLAITLVIFNGVA